MNPEKKSLVWNAIPTLFDVPNPPKRLASMRKEPKAREDPQVTGKCRKSGSAENFTDGSAVCDEPTPSISPGN